MLLSNLESRSTPNRCTAATDSSLPFRPLPPETPLPQSPPSHWCFRQMFGSPCNLAPTVSFSGVPSPILPNFPYQSQRVPLQSWTSSPPPAPLPVLVTVCVPQTGHALVRLASRVLRVNRVQWASSALNVNPVHQIVPNATRESQVPASASPPLSLTCRHPAIVSTVFAVPMDSVHAIPAGPLVPMAPRVRHAQRVSSRLTTVTAKVGSRLYPQYTPANAYL